MNKLLTRVLIGRSALRQFVGLPWQIRGSSAFTGRGRIEVPSADFTLMLEEFEERYICPVVSQAASDREIPLCPEWDEDRMTFGSTALRMFSRYDGIYDRVRLIFNFDYKPPVPDHGMPIYFWLGEQSDVV